MDGVDRAKLQETVGVREIVEDIDALRMMLGFDNVIVLTPKVEIRLRSGARAQIPLKLTCAIIHKSKILHTSVTFPLGYPKDGLLAEVTDCNGEVIVELTEKLQEFCGNSTQNDETYPRAATVMSFLRQLLKDDNKSPVLVHSTQAIIGSDIESVDTSDILMTNVSTLDSDQDLPPESDSTGEEQATEADDKYYSCMVCGHFLFGDNDVAKHFPTQKDYDRRGGKAVPCSSVFTSSPPSFFEASEISENTVKIACPKCHGKLGLICWTGSQCSCGAWVTPAFQFINSKVDLKRKNFDILAFTNLKSSIPKIRK